MTKVERSSGRGAAARGAGEAAGGGKRRAEGVAPAGDGGTFTEALEGAAATAKSENDAALDELLEKISAAARALSERQTLAEVGAFRELVRSFLDRVVSSYRVDEVPSARFLENQKVFLVVRKVDEALDALSAEVLSGHAGAVSILARTDEIRGLLLDLRS